MLGKKSGLKYCDVRDRYENFRSRCTEPLYGEKSKCIIKIVPKKNRSKTFQMDSKCIKKLG